MDSEDCGGKSRFDFSDIMSILDEGEQKKPDRVAPAKRSDAPAAASRDNSFVKKLLSDIEQKNSEILKLSSDNTSLKYSISEKEMEIKKLRSRGDSLTGQVESLKGQVVGLNQQIEDLNKFVNDARVKLGEMEADRSKLTSRIARHESEEAPPQEEDVAAIFKRIALKAQDPAADTAQKGEEPMSPKKPRTAKLYDL